MYTIRSYGRFQYGKIYGKYYCLLPGFLYEATFFVQSEAFPNLDFEIL